MAPIFQKVDCYSIPVANLDVALDFYRSKLGHELIWRTPTAAGLRIPKSESELVLHTEERPQETDLKVESVPSAMKAWVQAGGSVAKGPFEIQIGLCAVLKDPWDNLITVLDSSKGLLECRLRSIHNILDCELLVAVGQPCNNAE